MNEFNLKKLFAYEDILYTALINCKGTFNLISSTYDLFLKKFTKQLEKVTLLTYEHEIKIIEHYRSILDKLPTDKKRELKKIIHLHFRR